MVYLCPFTISFGSCIYFPFYYIACKNWGSFLHGLKDLNLRRFDNLLIKIETKLSNKSTYVEIDWKFFELEKSEFTDKLTIKEVGNLIELEKIRERSVMILMGTIFVAQYGAQISQGNNVP